MRGAITRGAFSLDGLANQNVAVSAGMSIYGDNNTLSDQYETFKASRSNSIYSDNGKVMPLSISKQSIIIYK